jgi:hypothetical protein
MAQKAGPTCTPPDSPAKPDRSGRARPTQTKLSSRRSDRPSPSSSRTSKAAIRAACECRSRAGPAPASSPGPIAPRFRPPLPRASTGSANPTDEPHEDAGSRLAPRSRRHARAERARKQGPGKEVAPYRKTKNRARGIGSELTNQSTIIHQSTADTVSVNS